MGHADTAIVTVTDRKFLPAACCQLKSVADHLGEDDDARLHLVVCDVSNEDIAHANDFFEARDMSVEIVAPNFLDQLKQLPESRFGSAACVRLFLDKLFDPSWRRVVYLDADTRVCAPLSPLLNADLHGQPVGAVHDFIYYVTGNIHRRRRDLSLSDDAPYLQSGVLVFDWPKTRASGGLEVARRFLAEHPDACREAPDQDALNAAFQDNWTPLDPRWNFHHLYLLYGGALQPWIMHFTTTKPWSRKRPRAWREAASWYQRELAGSPWSDFVEPQNGWQALRADVKLARARYKLLIRDTASNAVPFLFRKYRKAIASGRMPWVPRRLSDVEDMARALIKEAEGSCPVLRPPEAALPHGHW
jgi:lipopolysaccharide biosynthesis glycosyltransferase